jgi:hypothetical protein
MQQLKGEFLQEERLLTLFYQASSEDLLSAKIMTLDEAPIGPQVRSANLIASSRKC